MIDGEDIKAYVIKQIRNLAGKIEIGTVASGVLGYGDRLIFCYPAKMIQYNEDIVECIKTYFEGKKITILSTSQIFSTITKRGHEEHYVSLTFTIDSEHEVHVPFDSSQSAFAIPTRPKKTTQTFTGRSETVIRKPSRVTTNTDKIIEAPKKSMESDGTELYGEVEVSEPIVQKQEKKLSGSSTSKYEFHIMDILLKVLSFVWRLFKFCFTSPLHMVFVCVVVGILLALIPSSSLNEKIAVMTASPSLDWESMSNSQNYTAFGKISLLIGTILKGPLHIVRFVSQLSPFAAAIVPTPTPTPPTAINEPLVNGANTKDTISGINEMESKLHEETSQLLQKMKSLHDDSDNNEKL